MTLLRIAAVSTLWMLAATFAPRAQAAQGDDNCVGYIQSLPATITTPGTWCLGYSVSFYLTSGVAISIQADHVTLDCLHQTLGNAASGNTAIAVYANDRKGVTVRNCTLAYFDTGISLRNGQRHRVVDNLITHGLRRGIHIWDPDGQSHVEGNRVVALGGSGQAQSIVGIEADADIVDNVVAGVTASAANLGAKGIIAHGVGTQVVDNVVRGLASNGSEATIGLTTAGRQQSVVGNRVVNATGLVGTAISGYPATCRENHLAGYSNPVTSCSASWRNLAH